MVLLTSVMFVLYNNDSKVNKDEKKMNRLAQEEHGNCKFLNKSAGQITGLQSKGKRFCIGKRKPHPSTKFNLQAANML